jgi:hypothetical protein
VIEQTILLSSAWKDWLEIRPHFSLRFGQYFINQHTEGYTNASVFYETDPEKAYTELLWEICSGQLDGKLVDTRGPTGYSSETNQTGGA